MCTFLPNLFCLFDSGSGIIDSNNDVSNGDNNTTHIHVVTLMTAIAQRSALLPSLRCKEK